MSTRKSTRKPNPKSKSKSKAHTHLDQYPSRYPIAIRGRVESALFTCPREGCGTLIRFRARTQVAYRCPTCSTTFYVGLRVMIRRRQGGRVGIPLDSLLPKWRQRGQYSHKSATHAPIEPSTTGARGPKQSVTTARPDAINAVELVPAHPESVAEGSVESLPVVGLERWEPGEPLHRVEQIECSSDDNGDDDDAGDDAFKPELE